MADFHFVTKRKKPEITLLLDIGTETVKALLFRKNGRKIDVLANSLEYFDRFGIFDSRDFEKDVMEHAILRTIRKLGSISNKAVALGLPADILKARIVSKEWKRPFVKKIITDTEKKSIYEKVITEAQKNISSDFSLKTGILANDLKFISLKILENKIEGYEVPTISKYEGQNLSFQILATFLPNRYLEQIKNIIASLGLKVKEVVHEVEGLKSYFVQENDGIFIDMGGKITQIFLVKRGILEQVSDFPVGGETFSRAISDKLGLTEAESRVLKERYSKKELSKESSDRIEEILQPAWQTWFENLKLKLEEMAIGYLPVGEIFIFGGASQLPNAEDIFKTKGRSIGSGFDSEVKILENGQETPVLLKAHACVEGDTV